MNFLQKQNFMRPLIAANVPEAIRWALYYEYVRSGLKGPKYPGLNIAGDFN